MWVVRRNWPRPLRRLSQIIGRYSFAIGFVIQVEVTLFGVRPHNQVFGMGAAIGQKRPLIISKIRGYSLLLEMTFWLPIDIGLMVGDSPYAR